jgi:thioredoxin-dependent peroxiredoxin
MAIVEGKAAPEFTLLDQSGKEHSLSGYQGKYVVLYFYPRDNTPGCTKEACCFRDNMVSFSDKDCVVLGVSKDSAASHNKFIEKFELPFDLLIADEAMMLEYGAWGEKNNYGKKYMGIIRSTLLIGPDGLVIRHWPKIRGADVHPLAVLEALNEQ